MVFHSISEAKKNPYIIGENLVIQKRLLKGSLDRNTAADVVVSATSMMANINPAVRFPLARNAPNMHMSITPIPK